jgi:hypothetical protein
MRDIVVFVVLIGFCWLPLGLKDACSELGGGRVEGGGRGREGEGGRRKEGGKEEEGGVHRNKSVCNVVVRSPVRILLAATGTQECL